MSTKVPANPTPTMSWQGGVRGARDLVGPSVSVLALGIGFGAETKGAS